MARCFYNKISQTRCQNSKLINAIIKEELDFQCFVLSDWTAMINGVQVPMAVFRVTSLADITF
jgi:beta-glucosidase